MGPYTRLYLRKFLTSLTGLDDWSDHCLNGCRYGPLLYYSNRTRLPECHDLCQEWHLRACEIVKLFVGTIPTKGKFVIKERLPETEDE